MLTREMNLKVSTRRLGWALQLPTVTHGTRLPCVGLTRFSPSYHQQSLARRILQASMIPAVQRTPTEILLSIFEQDTFVPHAFKTSPSDPFDVPGIPIAIESSTQVLLQKAVMAKWSLALVCKRWNTVATPLLYQAVVIGSDHGLQSLHDTLIKYSRHISLTGDLTSGLRVRRLDFLYWAPSSVDVLVGVFQHLPDLEIFCSSAHPHRSVEVESCVQTLISNCAPSLRKCILSPHWQSKFSQSEYEDFIARCPRISYLPMPHIVLDAPSKSPVLADSLALLFLDSDCLQTRLHPIPSLQHVFIWVDVYRTPYSEKLETFFGAQGLYLRTVEFNMPSSDALTMLSLYFDLCSKYCPNLVHLILSFDYWSDEPNDTITLSIPANVTHLGLYLGWEGFPSKLAAHLSFVRTLSRSPNPLPAVIRRLRVLTDEEQKDLRENSVLRADFASIIAQCRLEDVDGNELFSPSENSDCS
ncbi:hypothetical protein DENSPDRAFT_619968 [Dentipellis sp. KUC8613]|nr:hypothetical protein DENSPDRAFT_619968 [Dentipellis sp. KUC8613]